MTRSPEKGPIRLQKLLAEAGLGSRRDIEEWIRAGRGSIAGRIARLGDRAAEGDDVRLDGVRVELRAGEASAPPEVLLYYKPPAGVLKQLLQGVRGRIRERYYLSGGAP